MDGATVENRTLLQRQKNRVVDLIGDVNLEISAFRWTEEISDGALVSILEQSAEGDEAGIDGRTGGLDSGPFLGGWEGE